MGFEATLAEIRRLCAEGTEAHGDEFYGLILAQIDIIDALEGIDTTNEGKPTP